MKCLIIAAGQGGRLRDHGALKPLVPIRGMALIARVIDQGRRAGIDEFVVVSGYRGEDLRPALDALPDVRIAHVVNDDWRRGNGVSVLCAKPVLDAPFILAMCDHLLDPAILRALMAAPTDAGGATLAVDHDLHNAAVDLDDVTRVQCVDGRIRRIGKLIAEYNCFDTGVFLCTPGLFGALAESQAAGDESISGAMMVLAARDQAFGLPIDGRCWIDVDDAAAYRRAEALLDAGLL